MLLLIQRIILEKLFIFIISVIYNKQCVHSSLGMDALNTNKTNK